MDQFPIEPVFRDFHQAGRCLPGISLLHQLVLLHHALVRFNQCHYSLLFTLVMIFPSGARSDSKDCTGGDFLPSGKWAWTLVSPSSTFTSAGATWIAAGSILTTGASC